MATSFGALCTDFYVNSKLSVKMDLPAERETILHLFDRVRLSSPSMTRFRRFDDELSLESAGRDHLHQWMSVRRTSVRTGFVNPDKLDDAYRFHRMVLEVTPYNLSISPLDVDYLEVLFGFDLECKGNHDEVVYDALFANSPVAGLLNLPEWPRAKVLDVQPVFGAALSPKGDMQVYFEVKTRRKNRRGQSSRYRDDPISLFLTMRHYGPVDNIEELDGWFMELAQHAERLASDRFVPDLLVPISQQIISSSSE